jgi:DNA-directed RNA polymerase subunit RPC12/RpoP
VSEAYTTCACQTCGKLIEFDRSGLADGETRTVECPHCQLETIIFARREQIKASKPQAAPPIQDPPKKKRSAGFLSFGSVFLFIVGAGLVVSGCGGDLSESSGESGSAIRQTVYALQYGFGFTLLGLAMILSGVARLITGE